MQAEATQACSREQTQAEATQPCSRSGANGSSIGIGIGIGIGSSSSSRGARSDLQSGLRTSKYARLHSQHNTPCSSSASALQATVSTPIRQRLVRALTQSQSVVAIADLLELYEDGMTVTWPRGFDYTSAKLHLQANLDKSAVNRKTKTDGLVSPEIRTVHKPLACAAG